MALSRRSSPSSLAVRRHLAVSPSSRYPLPLRSPQNRLPEILLMAGINLAIATIAGLTIVRLLPYNAEQQVKLQDLQGEVNMLENRVDHLRQDFTHYFDPQQTRSNMRALSDQLENGQRKIIFIDPPAPVPSAPTGEGSTADVPPSPTVSQPGN